MIWIIGCNGMLGKELCLFFDEKKICYLASDIDVDITKIDNIYKYIKFHEKIEWIINCSAYTNVDLAEHDKENAFSINTNGPKNLAIISNHIGAKLIHISTDYVFGDMNSQPRKETDDTNPQCIYGKTKLYGEKEISKVFDRFYIVRTSWLYGKYGKNFVTKMIELMNKNKEISVVEDQVGSPTWTKELARILLKIIDIDCNKYGIYHFSGEGETSWFSFAKEIYKTGLKKNIITNTCKIIPCTSNQYKTEVKRPTYSFLSKEKIKRTFNIEILDWKESLYSFFEELSRS